MYLLGLIQHGHEKKKEERTNKHEELYAKTRI